MKTNVLTTLQKIECLFYAIYIQSRIALPSIRMATDEERLFWRNVLELSGLNADRLDFNELVLQVRFSIYIKEIRCFGVSITVVEIPDSWSSQKIRQDPFYDKIFEILPRINKMLSELKSPIYITRNHPS